MTKQRGTKPIDQWTSLNNAIKHQKIANLVLAGFSVIVLIALMISVYRNPVVVSVCEEKKTFLSSQRMPVKLGKENIKRAVESFVKLRYEWNEPNYRKISKALTPFVTPKALMKISTGMEKEYSIFQGKLGYKKSADGKEVRKEIYQRVSDIRTNIDNRKILSSFIRLLVIDGAPLPIKTQLSLQVVRGETTPWNPSGLEVNGIIHHEVKHN